ncbi:MAG: HNH endonuclease [Bacilli bacterium]
MHCKNFKIRTKTINKKRTIYYYCSLLKQGILYDNCKDCANKEFKITKCTINYRKCAKIIKGKKHKLTKATDISIAVKKEVWERDEHKCIYCHKSVPVSCANSHYIKRSQLGLGIPQNIVTACYECHNKYEFGTNIQNMVEYTKEYLKNNYDDWNKIDLKYKK